jgi:hypothetical protein
MKRILTRALIVLAATLGIVFARVAPASATVPMRRRLTLSLGAALVITAGVALESSTPASAAPSPANPNILTAGTLACPDPIGTQAISFNSRTEDSPLRYLSDEETVVPKIMFLSSGQTVVLNQVQQEYGLYSVTLLSTNELVGLDDTNTGSESFGTGPTDRLAECSFQMHFEWTGVLDDELARAFEVAEEYIGEDVRISIDFDSRVKVIAGGQGS